MNFPRNIPKFIFNLVKTRCCFCTKSNNSSYIERITPQIPPDLKDVQRQRQHIRTKKNYAPGKVYLQVIGSGAASAPASVYLYTNKSRFEHANLSILLLIYI